MGAHPYGIGLMYREDEVTSHLQPNPNDEPNRAWQPVDTVELFSCNPQESGRQAKD